MKSIKIIGALVEELFHLKRASGQYAGLFFSGWDAVIPRFQAEASADETITVEEYVEMGTCDRIWRSYSFRGVI